MNTRISIMDRGGDTEEDFKKKNYIYIYIYISLLQIPRSVS